MIDKVTLQVLANHCRAAAESMAYTLNRTAFSTFVKETEDFTVGIANRAGLTVSVPQDLGATWFIGLDYRNVIDAIADYEEGDICVTNDPYSGYVCTHAPDLHMWKPIFHQGELVCFAVGHVHNTDVGGAVPGSLSRSLQEVHQEGIRIPPTKLYRRGVLNEDVKNILLTNVRAPKQNWGDIMALVGSLNTGERKIRNIICKFGVLTYCEGLESLLDHAEAQARTLIRSMPDGEYHFSDYIDEDGDDGNPIRIAMTLRIDGDNAVMDFTGTDPQLLSSHNVPTGGHPRHTLLLVAVYFVLYTLNNNLQLNAGLTRPFTCILPEGTLLNPVFPAAVGMRSLSCNRLRTVIFGAFHAVLPDKIPASPSGTTSILNVMTTNNTTGERVMAAVNPVMGGSGALPYKDGSNGSGGDTTYLKNSPIEITESEVPIQVLRYGLQPNSGAPGYYRGGLAQIIEFRTTAPNSKVTARGRDRSRFRSWGALGGSAGMLSTFTLNPGTDREVQLGNRDVVPMGPGDVIRIVSSSGGGRGNPFQRPLDMVLADLRNGYVTQKAALRDYGVVFRNGVIDETDTERERASRKVEESVRQFDFGPERAEYESVWTRSVYDDLTRVLSDVPVQWRYFLKTEIFARVRNRNPGEAGPPDIIALYRQIAERYPALKIMTPTQA
ncbi:hydantoinase B/oxoprolinase family protein [Mesorhizobium sp. M0968]|uniref:hydantoinase B/oxoprolinase family protein n=1 Tax=Mesorhizobium sp. M0968 TaxID=2957037 RepID=UPI003334CDF8